MIQRALPLCLTVLLAGCQALVPPPQVEERPVLRAAPPPQATGPSEESVRSAQLYRRVEQRLLTQGLLRQDGGGVDTPFDAETLAQNFERIALFSEYIRIGGRLVAQQNRTELRRWEEPVRVQLHFGPSVDPETKKNDTQRIESYVNRLRRVTGHPISVVPEDGNYHVFVATVDELANLGPEITAAEPALSRQAVEEITSLGPSVYCAVYASASPTRSNAYVSALAIIRAEHPDLMRLACYHEELAQGLGLANDSPRARPSIFNDDEEFALLTTHDELLLRMLYDDRLSVGLTADEARPIIRQIAEGLLGGNT
ncbi:MAG: DUF2927 domain-containing protein [Pseudomonadota bacterium]